MPLNGLFRVGAATPVQPTPIPPPHATFLGRSMGVLQADERLVGVAAAGSCASGAMDAFSDLDLVIAV